MGRRRRRNRRNTIQQTDSKSSNKRNRFTVTTGQQDTHTYICATILQKVGVIREVRREVKAVS